MIPVDSMRQSKHSHGTLLNPTEEMQILEDHFRWIFQAERPLCTLPQVPPLILTSEEIEQQLLANKAVAPNSIPATLAKALAGPLAEWLHRSRSPLTDPVTPETKPAPLRQAMLAGPDLPVADYWNSHEWCAWLSKHCSICKEQIRMQFTITSKLNM